MLRATLAAVKAYLNEEAKTLDKLRGFLPFYESLKGVAHTGIAPDKKKGPTNQDKKEDEEGVAPEQFIIRPVLSEKDNAKKAKQNVKPAATSIEKAW